MKFINLLNSLVVVSSEAVCELGVNLININVFCCENDNVIELFDEGVYEAINLETCVKGRTSVGGPSEASVELQVKLLLEAIK